MELENLKLEIKDYVAHLAFNRPDKANSLNETSWEEMKVAFDHLSDHPQVRVVILSGEGKHFCAGMDLETLMSQQQPGEKCEARKRQHLKKFIVKIQDCITSIEKCKKPVLTAIHGGCIGGGINIAATCDIRYCTEDAYFTIKEIDLGIVADIGVLQRMPHIVHPGIMAELSYTGRNVLGKEAKEIGLVNQYYSDKEEMMKAVKGIASMIASKSPLVVQGIKENLLFTRDHSVEDGLNYIANYNAGMLMSDDLMEAFQSYIQKKKPEFKDV